MNLQAVRSSFTAVILSGIAILLLIQYPLQTTFPIGGDATRLIQDVIDVSNHPSDILKNNVYPGSIFLLLIASMLPISWPELLTWIVTAGHVGIATALGLCMYKLIDAQAGTLAALLWAMASTGITNLTESGNVAQILSITSFILFIYLLVKNRPVPGLIILGVTFLLHPLSGTVGFLVLIFSLSLRRQWKVLLYTTCIAVIGLGILVHTTPIRYAWSLNASGNESIDVMDMVRSPFGPFLFLAPLGFIVFMQKADNERNSYEKTVPVFALMVISLLLAFNNMLGIGAFVLRFAPYAIITVIMCSSLAFHTFVNAIFPRITARSLFILMFITPLAIFTWLDNERIYKFYEYPGNYARLHPDEMQSIEWLRNNAPSNSTIISTRRNRHSEWIPILSGLQWIGTRQDSEFWNLTEDKMREFISNRQVTYAVLFKNRENAEETFPYGVQLYPSVFENKGAVIYSLTI